MVSLLGMVLIVMSVCLSVHFLFCCYIAKTRDFFGLRFGENHMIVGLIVVEIILPHDGWTLDIHDHTYYHSEQS